MRTELGKELVRLKSELVDAESEMEDLIFAAGVGAGDDQDNCYNNFLDLHIYLL
jgi:hypothetical protein